MPRRIGSGSRTPRSGLRPAARWPVKHMRADREIRRRGRDLSISPLAGHAERAAGGALQDERVDAGDSARLQDRKPPTS